jgi:hypothetical protein
MYISTTDDIKKRFHAACALCGLKKSQVITELIEQWLKTNETSQVAMQFFNSSAQEIYSKPTVYSISRVMEE